MDSPGNSEHSSKGLYLDPTCQNQGYSAKGGFKETCICLLKLDVIRLCDLCCTCQVSVVSFQLSYPGWNISVPAINWSFIYGL